MAASIVQHKSNHPRQLHSRSHDNMLMSTMPEIQPVFFEARYYQLAISKQKCDNHAEIMNWRKHKKNLNLLKMGDKGCKTMFVYFPWMSLFEWEQFCKEAKEFRINIPHPGVFSKRKIFPARDNNNRGNKKKILVIIMTMTQRWDKWGEQI